MSDAELIELGREAVLAGATHYMNFIAVLFAFLITVFLVGKQLNKVFSVGLAMLFTAFSLLMGISSTSSFLLSQRFQALLSQRALERGPHSELYQLFGGTEAAPEIAVICAAVLVMAYLGAIAYFIHVRRST